MWLCRRWSLSCAAHSPLAALLVRSHCGSKSPAVPGTPGMPASVQVRVAVVAMRAIGLESE